MMVEESVEKRSGQKGLGKRTKIGLVLLVMIACSSAGGLAYWMYARSHISTDDAYVEGHIVMVAPRVPGIVEEVFVTDNQLVRKGMPLVRLDKRDYEVEVMQAQAELDAARAQLDSAKLGVPLELDQTSARVREAREAVKAMQKSMAEMDEQIKKAEKDLASSEARLEKARLDLQRFQKLYEMKAISESRYDEIRTSYDVAKATRDADRAALEAARRKSDSIEHQIQQAMATVDLASTGKQVAQVKEVQVHNMEANLRRAAAHLEQARLRLSYTDIQAPMDGQVTKKAVEVGAFVQVGQPLMALVSLQDVWIVANFKETQLGRIRPGQKVKIRVDTYDDIVWEGRVDSIMSGTGSAFSLFPPENATGNYVKIVQRIPVKIVLDGGNSSDRMLRVGMSVIPTVLVDP